MKPRLDWESLLHVLEGKADRDEMNRVKAWIASSREHEKEFDLLQSAWNTPEFPFPKPDIEGALEKVMERAQVGSQTKNGVASRKMPLRRAHPAGRHSRTVLSMRPVRIAAVIAFAVAAPLLILKILHGPGKIHVQIDHGEIQQIILDDGSRLTLDAGSTFTYPGKFSRTDRRVSLDGEAYFEIAPDPERPFMVHANASLITVLGTEFNVRSWRQYEKVQIVVAKGSVSIRHSEQKPGVPGVIVRTGQVSTMRRDGSITPPDTVNVAQVLAWLRQEKVFQFTPFREVLDQLERWYRVSITLTDTTHASQRLNVTIEKKSLDENLDMLALVTGLAYRAEGNQIIFQH